MSGGKEDCECLDSFIFDMDGVGVLCSDSEGQKGLKLLDNETTSTTSRSSTPSDITMSSPGANMGSSLIILDGLTNSDAETIPASDRDSNSRRRGVVDDQRSAKRSRIGEKIFDVFRKSNFHESMAASDLLKGFLLEKKYLEKFDTFRKKKELLQRIFCKIRSDEVLVELRKHQHYHLLSFVIKSFSFDQFIDYLALPDIDQFDDESEATDDEDQSLASSRVMEALNGGLVTRGRNGTPVTTVIHKYLTDNFHKCSDASLFLDDAFSTSITLKTNFEVFEKDEQFLLRIFAKIMMTIDADFRESMKSSNMWSLYELIISKLSL